MKSYTFSVAIVCSSIATLRAMDDQKKEIALRTQALINVQEKRAEGRWAQPSIKQLTLPKMPSSDSGPVKRSGTPRPPLNKSCSLDTPLPRKEKPVVKQLTAGSGSTELIIVEEEN